MPSKPSKSSRGDPAAHFTLAEACLRVGERERAAEAFQAVAKLAPRTSGGVSALRRLAGIREAQGETSSAISDNEKILEWRPADISSYLALARLYGELGRWDRAEKVSKRPGNWRLKIRP